MKKQPSYFLGIDMGTSGARIAIINQPNDTTNNDSTSTPYQQLYSDSVTYENYANPDSWISAVNTLLKNTPLHLLSNTKSICVSGTSASCLLVDQESGKVTRPAKMYDYDISNQSEEDRIPYMTARDLIDKYAPDQHATRATTSALSKLLHYHTTNPIQMHEVLAHQSEYIANTMFLSNPKKCGASSTVNRRVYVSDWHNVLKLGYDVKNLVYPTWLHDCLDDAGISLRVLPKVVKPGQVISSISSPCSSQYGLPESTVVVGGTTDSNAAFIAATSGSNNVDYGTAVTSLGSTTALKMLSRTFVEDSTTGVYSHRFPLWKRQDGSDDNDDVVAEDNEAWLVGGASNCGCGILRKEGFSEEELNKLSANMNVEDESPLNYYPLTKIGERFPISDSQKAPIIDPKPSDRGEYLKGLFEGIARVEHQGYSTLGQLGSSPSFPDVVWSCGGGSINQKWLEMRRRLLKDDNAKIDVKRAENSEASYGAAVLAAASFL